MSLAANSLLTHRLSVEDYQRSVVQARKALRAQPRGRNNAAPVDASQQQAVKVRGFNSDAIGAIKTASNGQHDLLTTTYVVGRDMSSVIEQVEDLLRIPSEHWRLTTEDAILLPEDSLVRRASSDPIEILLIPEDTVVDYLVDNEHVRKYKNLKPTRAVASHPSDARAQAQAAFHLLTPKEDAHWNDYAAQRRNAEWLFARMLARSSDEDFVEFFTSKIRHSVESILKSTQLATEEQRAIADGVLPQGLEVEDDGSLGDYLCLVTGFTRIFPPSQPAVVDLYLEYMNPDLSIFYRIHDPAPPAAERLKIFNIRSVRKPTKPDYQGWSLLLDITSKRNWGLKATDAERIREALFGPLGARMSTIDAVLFVMAAVGIHMQPPSEDPRDKADQSMFKLVPWKCGPDWELGKNQVKWIGKNLCTACGDTVSEGGRKTKRQRVV